MFEDSPPREYQDGRFTTWRDKPEEETDSTAREHPVEATETLLDRLAVGSIRIHDLVLARERFVKTYDWVPYSQAEMTLALTGVKTKVDKIVGRVSDHTLSATERVYDQALAFKANAVNNLRTLEFAKALDEDEDPSMKLVRRDVDVKKAMADYQQAENSLNKPGKPEWLPRKGKRKSLRLIPRELEHRAIMEELEEMSDEELVKLWHEAYNSNWVRAEHWAIQETNARENELVAAIERERQQIRRAS